MPGTRSYFAPCNDEDVDSQLLPTIEQLRTAGYVQFISEIGQNAGLSDEMTNRAAIVFYERLIVVEQQLGQIHDAYQLE